MSRKTKISLSRLQSFLKAQCDRLRASMDASEYKNYIIALLFIKRINDQFEIDSQKLRDNLKIQFPDATETDIEEELNIPEKYNCLRCNLIWQDIYSKIRIISVSWGQWRCKMNWI